MGKERMLITGGHALEGQVKVSGGKNTAVAVIPATLLCDPGQAECPPSPGRPTSASVFSFVTVTAAMKLKELAPWKKSYDQSRQHIKSRHYFADKGPSSQSYGFSNSHGWM